MRFSTILLLVAIAHKTCSLSAQTAGVPEIQYRSVPDFLNLPADLNFGEVEGVAANSKGHIFVFSRGNTTGPAYAAAAAQLLEFKISAGDWPQPLCMVLCALSKN
jgi:hypothetical protein